MTMLSIYNSLTREQEPFTPIEPRKVRMYVCGMTVYDYLHIGHARVMVVFDMVARYLRARGYDVTYVRNITDIDDKIIKRAAENNEPMDQLTRRFIDAMHHDEGLLGIRRPDHEPRATQHIEEIVRMVEELIKRDYAYLAANRDVYYRVRKFAQYGVLSGKSLDEQRAGARVEVGEQKEDPLDFVLWKAAKAGEPSWPSPWGPGRPGWHIECSAMSTACLGNHFDIHGGGFDLRFTHHDNEIAQSEAATGEKFVNTWMHVGFVNVNKEKMSKSLGNFFALRDVLKIYHPEEIRYFLLASHYRSQLDYSEENLRSARGTLTSLYIALRDLRPTDRLEGDEYEARFHNAMEDDFNTAKAVAELSALATEVNRAKAEGDAEGAGRMGNMLKKLGGMLGLLQQRPEDYLRWRPEVAAGAESSASLSDSDVDALIMERTQARKNKNWAESDRIRDLLQKAGVVLEDSPRGTSWRRA
jgi:cysteinyl-tRNA synthetase